MTVQRKGFISLALFLYIYFRIGFKIREDKK